MSTPAEKPPITYAIYLLNQGRIIHRYPGEYPSSEEAESVRSRYNTVSLGGGHQLYVLPYDDDVPAFATER